MVKRAEGNELKKAAELAVQMWDGHTVSELAREFAEAGEETRFFLKYEGTEPVGFAQCQLRHDYVEGTDSSPVGYLEGIFVRETYRHKGYARELLTECERWAAEQGCREFASDCELENEESRRFHLAAGFAEANRIICFAKEL